jgi:hypothetical protein
MASKNKLCWTEADVKCPFYLADDRKKRSISCEGYCAGADVVSRFRTLAQRERHMGRYCVGGFARCPVYRCVYQNRYGEDA